MDALPRVTVNPGNAQILGQRSEQQDAFGFGRFDDPEFLAHGGYLAVLADGMGGLLHGGEAARQAVLTLIDGYAAKPPDVSIPAALDRALDAANREVHALAADGPGEGECGTTLVAAVLHGSDLHWVAVGDSRLYRFEAATGGLHQLNADHRYGRQLDQDVAAGYLTPDEAEAHPDRDALTSFLGLAAIPDVDRSVEPLALAPGDRVLLCSDGVYRALDSAELAAALALPAQAAAERIMAAANAADDPHQDNATVAVLALDPEPVRTEIVAPARRVRSVLWVLLALTALLAAVYHGALGERWVWPFGSAGPLDSATPAPGCAVVPLAPKAPQ